MASVEGLDDSWVTHTVQKLLTNTLNTLNTTTRMIALHFALNPTTTITQATNPKRMTRTLQIDHSPDRTNPINKKINSTLPANWMYIFLSFSSICGRPAGAHLLRTHESERTMSSPPMTLRLRRKNVGSKIRP